MPELPEVETVARGLKEKILGRRIESVELPGPLVVRGNPKQFCLGLQGQSVASILRHGKFLFLQLQPSETTLKIHLGMTGQLLFEAPSQAKIKHTHVIFKFSGLDDELRYRDIRRFGFLELLKKIDTNLGPDAWDSTDEVVFDSLRKKSGMLKHVLLNQSVIAGLGNIYVDESLFLSKLHPRKTLESLKPEKLKELCASIRQVLKESIVLGGTSFRNYLDTKGGRGGFKGRLNVYGKTGQPCPTCGNSIKRILVAGRSSHVCVKCQKK